MWAFSIWLESVAILPQLFLLQRTGEAETITTHYLFALGAYRAFYIPNWIYRYYFDPHWAVRGDPIAVVAGILQTILYSDFFWIYYTRSAQDLASSAFSTVDTSRHPLVEREANPWHVLLQGLERQKIRVACLNGPCITLEAFLAW